MGAFLIRRIGHMTWVLLAVLVIVSALLRLIPGDPVDVIMAGNPGITEDDKQALRTQLGLNDPLYVQIWHYFVGLIQGDFGDSLRFRSPVWPLLAEKLPPTIELTLFAMFIATLIAVPLGLITALYRDRPPDYIGSILSVLGISIPSFLLGILLILFLSVEFRVFPSSGYGGSITQGIRELVTHGDTAPLRKSFRYLVLPGVTLGVATSAYNARIIRSTMVEVLRQDYVRYAQAKGMPSRVVFISHAFRNALIPVVTILGLQFGYLLSGAFVIENVFAWPGLGRFSVQALGWRDYPVVQAVVLVTALIFLSINLLVDVIYVLIDPRIRIR